MIGQARLRRLSAHPALRLALIFGGFALLVTYRFALTAGAARNSDDAGNFLAGVEMAEGNWRLHGWMLAPQGYYTTDVFAQAVLRLLFGVHPILMQALEALIWAAIGTIGTGMACFGVRSRHLPGVIALALALLAFNVFDHRFGDYFISNIASHGSTILLTLIVFALLVGTRRTGLLPRSVALGLLVVVGAIADPIFDLICCAPVLAVSLLDLGHPQARRRTAAQIAAVIAGFALAQLALSLNRHNGGFQINPLAAALATFPDLVDHLRFAVGSIMRLLGAEFWGRPLDLSPHGGPLIFLLRAPVIVAVAVCVCERGAAVFRRIAAWPDGVSLRPEDELEQLLWFGLVFCVAGASVTDVIWEDAGARFLYPAAVTGAILVARRFGRLPLPALYGAGVLLTSILVGTLSLVGVPGEHMTIPQLTRIVDTLQRHGLRRGYGGYWEGTIITALSRRSIESLPLVTSGDGGLQPDTRFSNLSWFRRAARDWHGRIFFIVSGQPSRDELTADVVNARFGRPTEVFDQGQFLIEVHDLDANQLKTLLP